MDVIFSMRLARRFVVAHAHAHAHAFRRSKRTLVLRCMRGDSPTSLVIEVPLDPQALMDARTWDPLFKQHGTPYLNNMGQKALS